MAKLSQTDSRRMYSWWWDSHISPKNSKWLQENLTDMDAKVKVMIKLIEEDADSFARRAEMYYKKRPELMRLVEEFYRAYRALAERYDHATGVIRHAHRTMTEAFPNQVPLMFADDSPVSSGVDPRIPDMSTPTRALSEENDISNDVPGLSSSNSHTAKQNGEFTDDSTSVMRRQAVRHRSIESVQKGLNFDETEDKEHSSQTNENHHFRGGKLSKPDQISESEEILKLKEALARMETEKEAGLVQYQKNLDKLSQIESEISQTREDFRVLRDHATKAENEAVILKESLSKLETEKDSKLQEYQRCVDRLSDLESIISKAQEDAEKQNQRASTAETEAKSFKAELDKLAVEKDAALNQYMQSLEAISNLENKVQLIEEDAMRLKERAENAETEVELLKQTISKLTDEKEAAARQYQQCLETISSLEESLKCAQEEAKILNVEIDNGVSKLKSAEEQCLLLERSNQSLHSELESLMLKMGTQTQELTEKQQELGRLWACIQEERMRFLEAETAFQTLQHLHTQTQEELRSMASELQTRAQLLKVAETQSQSLQDEVLLIKEENKHLDELNASSSLSIIDMQNEISSLKESKEKLKEEIELRIDQRNALQQEIYCLKEELNDLNKKHLSVLEEVHTVGLNPDSFGSSVRQLQEENSNVKEIFHRERSEKEALLGKLEIFEQLLEKNSVLETSLSDLNAELEAVRGKIEALEQSLQSLLKEKSDLLDEKATLTIQLQETNKNMENLMENNTVVVNSLSDAHYQLEALKANSKELEDSCRLLANEKAGLISEKDGLTSQLENTQIRLEELGKIYGELECRCIALEKERESTQHKVEELQMSLEVERKEHANYIQMNESRFIGVEAEMRLMHEECHWRKREFDEVLDIALSYEIEMFVLCRTAKELELNNFSLLIKNQKLLEESILSEEKTSQLEKINFGQTIEIKSLCDQASSLRAGTYQLMEVLDIVQNRACMDEAEQDQVNVQLLLSKLQDMKKSLCKAEEENQQWAVELSILVTWMMQLRLQAQNLKVENNNIEHEFKVQTEQLLVVQSEVHKLLQTNEELRSKLQDEDRNKEAVMIQIGDLCRNIKDVQSTCDVLERERSDLCEEKRSLMEKTLCLEEKNNILEEENCVLCGEVLALDNLSLIFRNSAGEKLMATKELGDNINELNAANGVLMGKLSLAEGRLEESEVEMLHLKERLQKSEDELKLVSTIKGQLSGDIENGKNMLHQMELVLQEAEQKIGLVEKEKYELHKIVEDLKTKSDEFKIISGDQENQIFELSTNNNHLSTENNHLHEAIQILEVKLHKLHEEHNKSKSQGENLHFELKKKINEIDDLEIQAASVFGQLQYSMVCQLLFEQKFHELHETCLDYIDQNEGLKNQISSYGPEIVSLKECIASLENHTDSHIKLQNPEKEEFQGAEVTNDPHKNNQNKDERALMTDTFSDLQDLHARLQAVERASVAMKELMVQENMDIRSKLDASTRQVELLKSGSGGYRRSLKQTSEITEADNALLTKDIMLDQISNGSPYGLSKREPTEMDNQTVELWETADPDGIPSLTDGKSDKILSPSDFYPVQLIKEQKGDFPASDELIKEELSMDKLEISKRFTESIQEDNKRKVLERLDSDVQKLANLQMTVQDLKTKLEVTEKGRRGKAVIECESLKGQLEEADIAVKKLFDFNGRLMKTIEDSSFSDVKLSFDLEGDGNARKRVSEQARRMSEKIGRLHLEVQKLQFILLKLDTEKEGKTKISETKRRILLQDYLYGGRRTGQGRRKFCGCVQPSTIDD